MMGKKGEGEAPFNLGRGSGDDGSEGREGERKIESEAVEDGRSLRPRSCRERFSGC